jgi:hypothetical protein
MSMCWGNVRYSLCAVARAQGSALIMAHRTGLFCVPKLADWAP